MQKQLVCSFKYCKLWPAEQCELDEAGHCGRTLDAYCAIIKAVIKQWRTRARHQHNDPAVSLLHHPKTVLHPPLPHRSPVRLIRSACTPPFSTTPSTLTELYFYLKTPTLEGAISGFNVVYTLCLIIRWHTIGKRNVLSDGPYEQGWMTVDYISLLFMLFCFSFISCVWWIYVGQLFSNFAIIKRFFLFYIHMNGNIYKKRTKKNMS